MRSVVAAGAVMLLALVGLVACDDGGGPDPTPSTSDAPPTTEEPTTEEPTTDAPTLTQEELDVEEARQAFIDYNDAYDAAAQVGFMHGEELANVVARTGGDQRTQITEEAEYYRANGLMQTGVALVVSAEELSYSSSDGFTEVAFLVCLDLSELSISSSDGVMDINPRSSVDVVMWRQDEGWLVWSMDPRESESC